jgi:hypothetical protein
MPKSCDIGRLRRLERGRRSSESTYDWQLPPFAVRYGSVDVSEFEMSKAEGRIAKARAFAGPSVVCTNNSDDPSKVRSLAIEPPAGYISPINFVYTTFPTTPTATAPRVSSTILMIDRRGLGE